MLSLVSISLSRSANEPVEVSGPGWSAGVQSICSGVTGPPSAWQAEAKAGVTGASGADAASRKAINPAVQTSRVAASINLLGLPELGDAVPGIRAHS